MSKPKQSDDDILATAKERFAYSLERSAHNREAAKKDIRFAAASPDNPWQWDEATLKARGSRPTLTINKMPQHVNQVTNDIRQNRPSVPRLASTGRWTGVSSMPLRCSARRW